MNEGLTLSINVNDNNSSGGVGTRMLGAATPTIIPVIGGGTISVNQSVEEGSVAVNTGLGNRIISPSNKMYDWFTAKGNNNIGSGEGVAGGAGGAD
jgi:hypothetical protein